MLLWLQFAACTAAILFSGSRLSFYGDVVAEKTGMGRTWVGVILIASVTSLPELITGISSVALYNVPNIAAGDILGSCMFNLCILAALDIRRGGSPIFSLAHQGQVLTAAFGILQLGVVSITILAGKTIPAWGFVSASSPAILLLYLLAMRTVFKYEKKRVAEMLSEAAQEARYEGISKFAAVRFFALHALVLVIAATYLPHIGEEIATRFGIGQTFTGSLFVALATSLPEIVVARTALKMGAVDMAVGDVLGSNLFNVAILAFDDILYRKGSLFTAISGDHAITAGAAIVMTAIVMIELEYRSTKRVLFASWDALGVSIVYAVTIILLYLRR